MDKYLVIGRQVYGAYSTYEEAARKAEEIQHGRDIRVSVQYGTPQFCHEVDGPVEEYAQEEYPLLHSTGEHSAKIISRLADKMNRIEGFNHIMFLCVAGASSLTNALVAKWPTMRLRKF